MPGIKEMCPSDLDEVAALEKEIFTMPWSKAGFEESLEQEAAMYLICRKDGVLAGYCGLRQSFEEAEITNVAVAPGYRRQGVASALLGRLMEWGEKRGIRRYILEVRTGNEAALRLYEGLGFCRVGIRKNFYERPWEDAVIMQKEWQSL